MVEALLSISLAFVLFGGIGAVGSHETRALVIKNFSIVIFLIGIVVGAIIIALRTE